LKGSHRCFKKNGVRESFKTLSPKRTKKKAEETSRKEAVVQTARRATRGKIQSLE